VSEDPDITLERLLELRRVTSALASELEADLRGHLETLAPLLRPKLLLGDLIAGQSAESRPDAQAAFQALAATWSRVAPKPFRLLQRLDSPIPAIRVRLELHPLEDVIEVAPGKRLAIVSPFAWVMTYPGACSPRSLRRMLAGEEARNEDEIRQFVLHGCILQALIERSPGLVALFAALRLRLETRRLDGFGELPVAVVASELPSTRPSARVMLDAADLAGQSRFSEVIDLARVPALVDPLRARIDAARGRSS
jgi:hypothetical protein